ncbi:MAG: hypothetical protein HC794_00300, partial [Nitrospiraceae bacterium]|nr:hypothetical protein [Nitrospiraceae bacterium]
SALLAETPLSADQRTYTRAIEESARTLLALIDEILDFSRIEAGRSRSRPNRSHSMNFGCSGRRCAPPQGGRRRNWTPTRSRNAWHGLPGVSRTKSMIRRRAGQPGNTRKAGRCVGKARAEDQQQRKLEEEREKQRQLEMERQRKRDRI